MTNCGSCMYIYVYIYIYSGANIWRLNIPATTTSLNLCWPTVGPIETTLIFIGNWEICPQPSFMIYRHLLEADVSPGSLVVCYYKCHRQLRKVINEGTFWKTDALLYISRAIGTHDDVIKWKHFPRYWSFVRGIHRSPVNSSHKGQRRGALMFSLICAWINAWVHNFEAGGLRRHRANNDVIVKEYTRRQNFFCYEFSWNNKSDHILLCISGQSMSPRMLYIYIHNIW